MNNPDSKGGKRAFTGYVAMPAILTFIATCAFLGGCNRERADGTPCASNPLVGDWEIVRYSENGEEDSIGGGVGKRYSFGETSVRLITDKADDQEEYRYQLDLPKHHIDWFLQAGGEELEMKGIFELEGDTLKICRAFPGEKRPISMEAGKGDNRGLFVLIRRPALSGRSGRRPLKSQN